MAKPNKSANKPQPQQIQPQSRNTPNPAPARAQTAKPQAAKPSIFGKRNDVLVFGRENYKWMLIGIAVMFVGFICMAGGRQAPDAWDESVIYSPLRTIVAPFLILAGLVVNLYAIFKKNPTQV